MSLLCATPVCAHKKNKYLRRHASGTLRAVDTARRDLEAAIHFDIRGTKDMRNTRLSIIAVAISVAMASTNAFAATQTSNIEVSATIAAGCSISATPISFGAYDPISANGVSGSDLTVTGTVSTTCTSGSTATLQLDQGVNHDSGSTLAVPVRRMLSGTTDFLGYGLFSDASHSVAFDGVTGVSVVSNGTSHDTTVYGLIPKGQMLPVGSYNDTVVATVSF
jgi:spore coat protein U-like protein